MSTRDEKKHAKTIAGVSTGKLYLTLCRDKEL